MLYCRYKKELGMVGFPGRIFVHSGGWTASLDDLQVHSKGLSRRRDHPCRASAPRLVEGGVSSEGKTSLNPPFLTYWWRLRFCSYRFRLLSHSQGSSRRSIPVIILSAHGGVGIFGDGDGRQDWRITF